MTSDVGGLLLGSADKAIGLVGRSADCFRDARDGRYIEHTVARLVGQRVFGIALGYEDLNDHDDLRHDPVMSVLVGKLEAWRPDCAGGRQIHAEPTVALQLIRVDGRSVNSSKIQGRIDVSPACQPVCDQAGIQFDAESCLLF